MLRKRRGMSNIDVQYVPVTHKSRADGTSRSGRVRRAHVDAAVIRSTKACHPERSPSDSCLISKLACSER